MGKYLFNLNQKALCGQGPISFLYTYIIQAHWNEHVDHQQTCSILLFHDKELLVKPCFHRGEKVYNFFNSKYDWSSTFYSMVFKKFSDDLEITTYFLIERAVQIDIEFPNYFYYFMCNYETSPSYNLKMIRY